jgi:hypothetical protein
MPTRSQRLRRRALLLSAPILLCLPAVVVTSAVTSARASQASAAPLQLPCILPPLCLPLPTPTLTLLPTPPPTAPPTLPPTPPPTQAPTPPPVPTTSPPAPTAPPVSTPSGVPVPVTLAPVAPPSGGSPVGGVIGPITNPVGAVTGAVGGATNATGAGGSTSAPKCTLDLLGNCVSVLPGILGPVQQPSTGSGSGNGVIVPPLLGLPPVLSLGQLGCIAAVLGTCAAGTTPPSGSQQSCLATLLTLCVPNAPGSGGSGGPLPPTCVLNGVVCLSPPPCVGTACVPGGTPGTNPTTPPNSSGGSNGSGSLGGSAGTGIPGASSSSAAGSQSAGALGFSFGNSGLLAQSNLDSHPTSALGVAIPALPTSSALGWLSGLSLGALLLWPIFAILDALAAAALVFLARRLWSAVPAD